MERITKVIFDPLVITKTQVKALLQDLPAGYAHPFSPERLLLCRTASGIDEIDISLYPESHFFKAVDLGELGQTLQERMTKFPHFLKIFNDQYTVQQAPTSPFKVPIDEDKIAILAVSERNPTYYDFCVADAANQTTCYGARNTFDGMEHSGDHNGAGNELLHFVKISKTLNEGKPFVAFVSGYSYTKLTRFQGSNPVVMVVNHAEKALYIVPIPLDTASIGDATLCCPVTFKREGDSLIYSILAAPTTDLAKMCSGSTLRSESFDNAIQRTDWTISERNNEPNSSASLPAFEVDSNRLTSTSLTVVEKMQSAVFITESMSMGPISSTRFLKAADSTTQIIRYGTGLRFYGELEVCNAEENPSTVVLPCIVGRLEGPLLLATGRSPQNVPFGDEESLRAYYGGLKSVVVFVDERMTDNSRNLASAWRINAVFVIQVTVEKESAAGNVTDLMNLVNINAVTALAGPQSLVLVHIAEKFYFYRGIANRIHLNTSDLIFGSDVTDTVYSVGLEALQEPRAIRMIDLRRLNLVLLPKSGQTAQPQDLESLFERLPIEQIQDWEEDISSAVPQLQAILAQKELADLSRVLVAVLSKKITEQLAPLKNEYIKFLTTEFEMTDPESIKKKNSLLSVLRKKNKHWQRIMETIISHLSNMLSSQTTSKRTHDLKRLQRQTTIQSNVEAVKSMTFENLATLLEEQASEMGVLFLDIETSSYQDLLGNLGSRSLNANNCCNLDPRLLFLEGLSAGIILQQSQSYHNGPLKHQLGASHPILALPNLDQNHGTGSMLAFVCWDEFVSLDNPYSIRWMEKCNDSHIAALRIVMRDTLSRAVASREHNLQAGSPEVGQLMSALLKAAMSKLAATKTSPSQTVTVDDTVTKLMRGLFGNLLTTAGSGVRPMSMVWQLFGLEPKFDVPSTPVAWSWYESVVHLYPFTAWPQEQFNRNLEKLLTKALLAVITKNEIKENVKAAPFDRLMQFCKLRNIQLENCRTFVTVFLQMKDKESEEDRKAISTRLLASLPPRLEKQSKSYTKMIRYLRKVAATGSRREEEEVVVVSVFLKRSGIFKELKEEVAAACRSEDDERIKKGSLAVIKKFEEIAESWEVPQAKLIMQNAAAYQGLLDTHPEENETLQGFKLTERNDLKKRVIGDAERARVPWQVGKSGEFGNDIEPLDKGLIHEIMTGEKAQTITFEGESLQSSKSVEAEGIRRFSSVVQLGFMDRMENLMTPENVCTIMNVPVSTMKVFATSLNPEFNWNEDLVPNFRQVVVSLLEKRKEREKQLPIRALFGMELMAAEDEAGGKIESW